MKKITEKEYQKLQELKRMEKKLKVKDSVNKILRLEDDIDKPIKKCVALFALLGCDPMYSCCGFDYDDQPFHKSHQYGNPYVKLRTNGKTIDFVYLLSRIITPWRAKTGYGFVDVELIVDGNPHWRSDECIHFSEECAIGILSLENILVSLNDRMLDGVVVLDTNKLARDHNRHWQYPPKEPWNIKKSDWV